MRLAISNIAWDITEDESVAGLLKNYRLDAIDIAPGKYFPLPVLASNHDIERVKNWWASRGINITGMQALLFGTTGLNVFGTDLIQHELLQHLGAICRIGSVLGAKRIVFGSPKNRDRSGLTDAETLKISTSFFRRLGDIALSHGVMICLEPNPTHYGANFMTTSLDTAAMVRHIAHPAIMMQLDTGAITMNNEQAETVLQYSADIIGHVHASEPNLLPLGDGGTDHAAVSSALTQHLPQHLVTIEMVATSNEAHIASIERALKVAILHYRNDETGAAA